MSREISVNNFDVMRLSLRQELDRISKKISSSKSKDSKGINLSLDVNGMADLMEGLLKLMELLVNIDYSPKLELPEIKLPQINVPEVKMPEIKIPPIFVPEPKVTVTPEVNIDIRGIIDALDNLKYLSDRPNKPLSVRMSDGNKFVKALQKLERATDNLGVVYSGSSGLSTDDLRNLGLAVTGTVGDGSRTVTTAGTRVALSATSVPCRKVKIVGLSANTGTIWVGGVTVASGRGEPLVALQSTDFIETNNLSNIYIDSTVNGEGVSYIYV